MNGKKAKELRKKVYGNYSLKDVRYSDDGKTFRCIGIRKEYLNAKKENQS